MLRKNLGEMGAFTPRQAVTQANMSLGESRLFGQNTVSADGAVHHSSHCRNGGMEQGYPAQKGTITHQRQGACSRKASSPRRAEARRLRSVLQLTAINRTIEAIAKGQQRVLLVMATGTRKTFTSFQIIIQLGPGSRWTYNQ